jgi:hypothetical protein
MVHASSTSWISSVVEEMSEEIDEFAAVTSRGQIASKRATSLQKYCDQRRHGRRSHPGNNLGTRRRLRKPMGV